MDNLHLFAFGNSNMVADMAASGRETYMHGGATEYSSDLYFQESIATGTNFDVEFDADTMCWPEDNTWEA